MMRAVARTIAVWGLTAAGCGGAAQAPPAAPSGSAPSDPTLTSAEPARGPETAPSAELLTGIKAFDAGHFDEARASFEAASRKNPNDSEALFNLGLACEKLDDKAAAEKAYKAALVAKPDLDAAAAELSALYDDEGRTDDAIVVARAGLRKRPTSAPLHENLGVALAMRGERDDAQKELEQAAQNAKEPMYQLTLAHWLNVFHVPGAKPHLDVARDLAKDDYGMVVSIGHEYRMAGEFDACVTTFDRAVSMKDGGEVRTERALCHHGLKDDRGALGDLQAAVKAEPTYAPAHYYLGGRLAEAKRFKEAVAEYRKVIELEPGGSLAKPAAERMKAAQTMSRDAAATKKK